MRKISKEKYKKYFFNGIENREDLLEGILFFTDFEMLKKDIKKIENLNADEKQEILIKRTIEIYKQFHRFVELNDKPNIYNYIKSENIEEIERKVRLKVEELMQKPEYFSEEEIQKEIEMRSWPFIKYYYHNDWRRWIGVLEEKDRKRIEEETRREMANTKVLNKKDNSLDFSTKRSEYYLKGMPRFGDEKQDELKELEKDWTEEVFDILKFLEEAEQKDPEGYLDLWLRTRLSRAATCEIKNRIPGIEEKEISRLKHACERLREIRIKESKIEQSELEID